MRRLALLFLLAAPSRAQDPAEILPPVPDFAGKSRALAVAPDHPWATPCEKSGLAATPRYDETVAWLRRLADASDDVRLVSLGKSHEGRDIWMAVASRGPGKPTLLAQGGIHAGEIDGKDAGMMLLRDLTVGTRHAGLLDGATFLFVPILSVDGHERFGRFSRVNQRGPVEMGWRTNGRNLNLNRDYAKLDTPGVRAAVKALRAWKPDLYYDLHVTDGADYQYDITWGYNGPHAHSPDAARWMQEHLDPALTADLEAMGHVPGPLVFAADPRDMTQGNHAPTFGPRYSNGYGDLAHTPTILVENHSLKPYDQRVLGTYVLLATTLRVLGEKGDALRKATAADRARRRDEIPLSYRRQDGDPGLVAFKGIEQKLVPAPLIGGEQVVYTGKPVTLRIPLLAANVPDRIATRPAAYWIPPSWPEVIERLEAHGIVCERIPAARVVAGTAYRVEEWKLDPQPFEGRVRVDASFQAATRRIAFPRGSVRVSTDQPLGDLAVHLLEPTAPDSFFRWGFFLEVLQRTEYVENYAMVPLARLLLKSDPALKAAYEEKVAGDAAFRDDPRARLRWLYGKTPYFDARWRVYPVVREEK